MALSTYAEFKALCEAGRLRPLLQKDTISGGGPSSFFVSHWLSTPFAGATPSTAVACGRDTVGNAWVTPQPFGVTNPLYLAEMESSGVYDTIVALLTQGQGWQMLIDRLSHQGGLSGIVTTEQTTNLPTAALTRYTSGVGVMIALEIYSLIGTTAQTVTVNYTNQDGTAGRTSKARVFGGAAEPRSVGSFAIVPLQDGDTGVRSVEGVTLSGTTGTAGNFGVVLFKPLALIPVSANGRNGYRNSLIGGGGNLEKIDSDACLGFLSQKSQGSPDITLIPNLIEVA